MDRPEWLVVGATVAEEVSGGTTLGSRAIFTKVERLTKTLVFLANGSRYRIDRLTRSNGTYGPFYTLIDGNSDEARRLSRLDAFDTRRTKLEHDLRNSRVEDLTPAALFLIAARAERLANMARSIADERSEANG